MLFFNKTLFFFNILSSIKHAYCSCYQMFSLYFFVFFVFSLGSFVIFYVVLFFCFLYFVLYFCVCLFASLPFYLYFFWGGGGEKGYHSNKLRHVKISVCQNLSLWYNLITEMNYPNFYIKLILLWNLLI